MQSFKAPDYLGATAVSSRSRSPSVVSSESQYSRVNLMSPPSVRPSPGEFDTLYSEGILFVS